MSCGIGSRLGSDPALLWLWRRPATTAPIGPLARESPYAAGAALEKAKRQGGGGVSYTDRSSKMSETFCLEKISSNLAFPGAYY